ncbi:MAG TPA: alginate export family protein [Dokdonella sp.]|nr:alginate export family protein [Dokdonella sp.]
MRFRQPQLAVALAMALASHGAVAEAAESTKCVGSAHAGETTPTPVDPYPLMAAGWGPELGNGFMASRWAEDWSGMAAHGRAPAGKFIAIGESTHLTLSSEIRVRATAADDARLREGDDVQQDQARLLVGADLRFNPGLRVYGELGAGVVDSRRDDAPASFANDISLQQLFVDVRDDIGGMLVGAMLGRQEFSDGPRQLISLGDGANLHRTWNGIRAYAHAPRVRLGAFDLRATRLGSGAFDERIDAGEKLQGIDASIIVSESGPNTFLEPFWIRSRQPAYRRANATGPDERDTVGARLWGRRGELRFDWVAARQSGQTLGGRRVQAWGLFSTQSIALSQAGWKPRLTAHVDLASGGGAYESATVRDFNPLYASSNYLGEAQFLGLSNLLMIAPGIAVSPTPRTSVAVEYGRARRLDVHDAIYAGGGRAYAGTETVTGRRIGDLARLTATWSIHRNLALRLNVEHLAAGDALRLSGHVSGTYAYVDTTFRY